MQITHKALGEQSPQEGAGVGEVVRGACRGKMHAGQRLGGSSRKQLQRRDEAERELACLERHF